MGCRNLPEILVGKCGNRVIESGETCDGVPIGGAECRPPGSAAECHLDCSPDLNGTRPTCPVGSGCDAEGVCRAATGRYTTPGVSLPGNAYSVLLSDFDGDGRADVVSQEAAGTLGATKVRLHYFDPERNRFETWVWPRTVAGFAIGQISDDQRSDIVFADGRIGLLLGQPDRSLISETYPTYFLPKSGVRVAGPLFRADVYQAAPLLIAADSEAGLLLERPDSETTSLKPVATLPGHRVDDLAGELAIGDIFDADSSDPCLDTALALRGATEAHVFSACTIGDGEREVWRDEAGDFVVPLEPAAPITSGPLVGDVDGDGHLDLVIGTDVDVYVSFGDGRSLGTAKPYTATVYATVYDFDKGVTAPRAQPFPMPLAIGDFSGDGPADLVYPSGFFISIRRDDGGVDYRIEAARFGATWTTARVADLNANGKLDVIAASSSKLDIDFFNGTAGKLFNPFVIPTARPVRTLTVGDFDGDLIDDLAYLEIATGSEPSEVMVAFGNPAGPPSKAVTAARTRGITQIGALDYTGSDLAAELFVAYAQTDASGEEGSAFAWLTGFDRTLICLVELTTFSADGSIQSMPGLTTTLGAFTSPGARDVVSLASPLSSDNVAMWLVPDMRSRTGQPVYLGWHFDDDIQPLRGATGDPADIAQLDALFAAGDFDADGLDELVLAAPSADAQHCRLALARIHADGTNYALTSEPSISLDQSCASAGQIAVEDVDGDSALDIVLLTGRPGEARDLLTLWNDGAGHFSADNMTSMQHPGDTPEAFALYRPTPNDRVRIAYVTRDALQLRQTERHTRALEDVRGVNSLELERPTGIAAADVDGDGIADLVIADAGSVKLFRAELTR